VRLYPTTITKRVNPYCVFTGVDTKLASDSCGDGRRWGVREAGTEFDLFLGGLWYLTRGNMVSR
jgi:hypothetical protein